jgi:hypothetical protein
MTAYAIAHRDKYIKLELNKDNYYDEPAWYEADLNDKDFYISTSKNKINELLNAIIERDYFDGIYINLVPLGGWYNRITDYKIVKFNLVKDIK